MTLAVAILALALIVLVPCGFLARWMLQNPRADVATGLAWRFVQLHARLVHRVRFEGLEHLPRWRPGDPPVGPLVIVANHTAGVDPLLIQAAASFEISWMMLRAMMLPWAQPLWEFCGVIPVSDGDSRAAREAIRVLKSGGAIGIFPEGGIERPSRTILPFEPGVGLIIHRTGARVLQVIIDGTPPTASAFASLITPSRARVRFLPIRSYAQSGLHAAAITQDLQRTLEHETHWPVVTPSDR